MGHKKSRRCEHIGIDKRDMSGSSSALMSISGVIRSRTAHMPFNDPTFKDSNIKA